MFHFHLIANVDDRLMIGASTITGFAVATGSWLLCRLVFASRKTHDNASYEGQRRAQMRTGSMTYRWLEPLVDELAAGRSRQSHAFRSPATAETQLRVLQAAGQMPPLTYAEFLAVRQIEGVLFGLGAGALILLGSGPIPALFAFIVLAAGYVIYSAVRLKELAEKRTRAVLRRMPYSIDLMALVMEAGGTFDDALRAVVEESPDHPTGQEFASIQRSIRLGRSRREAFGEFSSRLDQEDVREFTTAVLNGEEFGTPLATILRTQADQMRLKRSQWAEKAAGTAEVQIVFPGIMIMAACLLVVAAPIVLKALDLA